MSEVSLKKLTKVYGGTTVVDHIDLTVPDGTPYFYFRTFWLRKDDYVTDDRRL